jgi:predicted amidohydrolase YtcJ
MRSARDHGLPVAVHCVTRVALALTIAALDEVGAAPGDRIEHGAVIAPDHHEALRRLGLTVVTQPNFIAERGDDYLADVDVEDRDHLWPAASLIEAGIPVAAGTDAPFGRPDPWALLHAAVRRRAPSGALVGAGERLDAARALDMLLGTARSPGGPSRRVAVGEPADLCLLALPLRDALDQLPANPVRATIIGGQLYE